jgi:two-component system response regulator HydG
MRVMMQYDWPGNVRELENSVEHAVVLAKSDHIHNEDLPEAVASPSASPTTAQGSIKANEARLLQETLEACGWNKRQAARKLGISRNTLYRKLRKYRIQTPTIH